MLSIKNRIVLVTNIKKIPNAGYGKHMSSFDINKSITNKLLARAIKKAGHELIQYSCINDFVKNIDTHKNDLIFPYCHGVASKIRQSFIQTFCESYGIKYVGGDAYSQTLANDKALSKEICRHAGIITPNCKIVFDTNYLPDIYTLALPLIIKPQFEGDSIGISNANIFNSHNEALHFAMKLFDDLKHPVIIEEFIDGDEFSACLIGYKRKIKKIGLVEYIKKGSVVNSYRDKKFKIPQYKNANNLLNEEILYKLSNLFHSLDKIEFMRVDFIFRDNAFYNIELSADPALSPLSCMYFAFKNDMNYKQFIEFLITNCIERYLEIEGR